MHKLVGKRIRCDRGFHNQNESWFGIIVDVYDEFLDDDLRVRIQFDRLDRMSSMLLSELDQNFFVIEASTEEFE